MKINYTPTPKQQEAHDAKEKYLLYGGAVGGGKSFWLCAEAIRNSVYIPKNMGYMCRYELDDFRRTVLPTLEAMLPQSIIKNHHKTERFIELKNGSRIYYGGLREDRTAGGISEAPVKSMNLGYFCVDQAEEISERGFLWLASRLRHIPEGYNFKTMPLRGFLTSNPQQGWLRTRFIENKFDNHRFIPALPKDNPYLPPDYESDLRKIYPESMIRQLLDGNWDVDETGNYLFPYALIRKATLNDIQPEGMRVAGVDIARYGLNKSVYILRQGGKVLRIEYWAKQDTVDSAGIIARYAREDKPDMINIDAIALGAGVYDQLSHEGVFNVNEVNVGMKALESDIYRNRRAEYYHSLAKLFEEGLIQIPNDDYLLADLAKIKYEFKEGKMRIQSKEVLEREEKGSPDFADALMLSFIGGVDSEGVVENTYLAGGCFG